MRRQLPPWYVARLREGQPIPGYYRRRLVKGGPLVPALVYYVCPMDLESGEPTQRSRTLLCRVNGEQRDPYAEWTWLAGNPITEKEYQYLEALRIYAEDHEPRHPAAQPRKAIDPLTAPPPY